MKKITEVTRRDLFDIIQEGFRTSNPIAYSSEDLGYVENTESVRVYMPFSGRLTTFEFLDRVYSLEDLPSTDRRFKSAKGDVHCHTVSFDDWPEYWFLDDERFQLQDGSDDEYILKFICEMLHPAVREENTPWKAYLDKFNEILRPDGYELYAAYRISGRNIYKYREYEKQKPILDLKNLFSRRYKEFISTKPNSIMDNISGFVDADAKLRLSSVMHEFAEPMIYKPNRYSNYTVTTTALDFAFQQLVREFGDSPCDDFVKKIFLKSTSDTAKIFTPHLFNLIELQFSNLSLSEAYEFKEKINEVFEFFNLPFLLSDAGLIEKLTPYDVLSLEIAENIASISEPGLKELLEEAISLHMQPNTVSHKDAVEKMWDALERLKTYHTSLSKKDSATKIVNAIAGEEPAFVALFNTEFKALTDIGNDFRIRHHETNRTDIKDLRHYDYFFNRCLSLVSLAIQYLQ